MLTWSGASEDTLLTFRLFEKTASHQTPAFEMAVANTGLLLWFPENLSGSYFATLSAGTGTQAVSPYACLFADTVLDSHTQRDAYYGTLSKSANHTAVSTSGDSLHIRLSGIALQGLAFCELHDPSAQESYYFGLRLPGGRAHYLLDMSAEYLSSQGFLPKEGQVYYLRATLPNGHGERMLKLKYTAIPHVEGDIVPVANYIDCGHSGATEIEYFPSILDGTAPYTVDWHVSSTPYAEDAWMSKSSSIPDKSDTRHPDFGDIDPAGASILVGADLGYYLLLKVTDACGKVSEKVVHTQCQPSQQGSHTVNLHLIGTNSNTSGNGGQ